MSESDKAFLFSYSLALAIYLIDNILKTKDHGRDKFSS